MTLPIVKRFLISLDRNKWIGLFSFMFVVGVSGIVAVQTPPAPDPVYRANGTLTYSPQPVAFTATGESLQAQGREITPDIIKADWVIENVAQQLSVEQDVIKKIIAEKQIDIRIPKEDEPPEYRMQYVNPNKQAAETVLASFMQAIVDYSRERNTFRLKEKIEELEKRLPDVLVEVKKAEQALDNFVRKEGSTLLAAQDGTLVAAITGAQEQQRQLKITLQGIETQIKSLEKRLGLTADEAYTSAALSADPIIANLRAQIYQTEAQIELLEKDLRPEHPQMVELRRQQQANEQLLRERAAEVVGGQGEFAPLPPSQIRQDSALDPARQQLANNLVALQTQRETLIQQLAATRQTELELRETYQTLPNKQMEQARLQQEVQLQQSLYGKIQAALLDAQAAEAETVGSLTVTQKPVVKAEEPEPPMSPIILLGAGVGIGVLVAGGVIFLLSTLDNKLYTPEELRESLSSRDVLLLGELPHVFSLVPVGEETGIIESDSPYLPLYERFRSNLRRLGAKPPKVVLITSVSHEEGKTVTAYNLAIASAAAGKRTLLIEANLRDRSSANALKLAADPDAAVEPLRYYASRNDCIRLVPEIQNLYLVPSPGLQRQAAAIIESSELRKLIEDARGRFDFVVLDTPSLSSCNDALLLEPLTDGIVLVTRPGYTIGAMLTETADQFTEAELPLLGAVINDLDKFVPLPSPPEEKETHFEETDELAEEETPELPPKSAKESSRQTTYR
ncbi:MAG: lipopolysaccharide biosynthesis [Oscillatoria sp. PMC 1068.18]|nr:lipopolysaccharide biosynthesis [Oscillatoria sp. PMC 1076.18]MEC4990277.1 lipopolysaccharide biosynthesis [Oscillatoria sp. PMC 1068.18]